MMNDTSERITDLSALQYCSFAETDISDGDDNVQIPKFELRRCENESSDESDINDDLFVEPPSESKCRTARNHMMYQRLKADKSEEETRANRTFAELTLDEQGRHLASQISENFFKWVKHTGMENLRIDENTLEVLFEVGMDNPSVRSLDVNVRELPTVPRTVANAHFNHEKSERAALHRQIIWDARYETVKPKYLAFGRRHPRSHKSWKKNVRENWFSTGTVSGDIVSGRAFWGGLLETKVLEDYCKWLRVNPHYKRPEYLENMGYLDQKPEDDKFKDDEMENELKISGRRNYWLFNNVKYLEEEEKFKEELQMHPEIVVMLKE